MEGRKKQERVLEDKFPKGWLYEQFEIAEEEIKKWPEWMRRQLLLLEEQYSRKYFAKVRSNYSQRRS